MVNDSEGLDKIESLQNHDNNEIYEKGVKILEPYWMEEEDDTEPPADEAKQGFQFRGGNVSVSSGDFNLPDGEIAFFDVTRTGELLGRLSEDTQIIKNAATTNHSEALRNLSTSFIGLGFMFTTSWKLTLLAVVVVPLISVVVRQYGRYLRELSHKTQAAAAVASSIANETFGAIRTVRSFAQEEYEVSRYSEKVDETLKLGLRQARIFGFFFGGLNSASTLSVIVVVIYGAKLTIKGSMTPGDLTSFILYSLTVASSVSGLSSLYTVAMKAAVDGFPTFRSCNINDKIRT